MGTPSSSRIIEDIDMALKALETIFFENGATVEGLAVSNVHRRRVVV